MLERLKNWEKKGKGKRRAGAAEEDEEPAERDEGRRARAGSAESADRERDRDRRASGYQGYDNPEGGDEGHDRERRRRHRDRRDERSPGRYNRGYDDRYGGDDYYGDWGGYHPDRRDRGRKERQSRSKIEFPSFQRPMYNRKDFELYQESKFDQQSIYEAYNDYMNEYKRYQEQTFYKNHRNDPWFIEKYDPCEMYKQKQNLKHLSQYQARLF